MAGVMLVVALALAVLVPLRGSSTDCRLRLLWLPGILAATGGGGPSFTCDVGLLLTRAMVIGPVFYGLVGFLLGASFRRLKFGFIACALLWLLILGGALAFDLSEARSRVRWEQDSRRQYWEAAERSIRENPCDVHAHGLLAYYAFRYYDQHDLAVKEFGKVIELEAEQPTGRTLQALLCLAIIHKQRGDAAQAGDYHNQYVSLQRNVHCTTGDQEAMKLLEKEYLGPK